MKSVEEENYSVSFEIKVSVKNQEVFSYIGKEFLRIKEEFYIYEIKNIVNLIKKGELKKFVLNLSSNDFICFIKTGKQIGCFFVQQEICDEERYYYTILLNEFEENIKLEGIQLFLEIIDLDNEPGKITKYFPEIVDSLELDKCFVFLLVFDPKSKLTPKICVFLTEIVFKIRKHYFSVKSSFNKFIKKRVENLGKSFEETYCD